MRGQRKALCDSDWNWASRFDRGAIGDLMTAGFMKDAIDVAFIRPYGVGASTLAKNFAQHALMHEHDVLFMTAGEMLGELAGFNLLVIDEIDDLSCSNRHADLLCELISRRYQKTSAIVISNRLLSEWHEVLPNATCLASLVDPLVHRAAVISIEGESSAEKEAH